MVLTDGLQELPPLTGPLQPQHRDCPQPVSSPDQANIFSSRGTRNQGGLLIPSEKLGIYFIMLLKIVSIENTYSYFNTSIQGLEV